MKSISIKINGESYPASLSMGALLYYKREQGYEFNGAVSASDLYVLCWAMIKAGCKSAGRTFDMSCEDFLCSIDTDAAAALAGQITEFASALGGNEKKTEAK